MLPKVSNDFNLARRNGEIEMYKKIVNILDSYFQDRWFLDSGSLLGIIRDGKFLQSDQGIDISVMIDDYSDLQINKVITEFENIGFIISRYNWGNTTYKYCLSAPRGGDFKYAIDLHLFKKRGTSYYCPQVSLNLHGIEASFASVRKGNVITNWGNTFSNLKVFVATIYRYVFKYFNQPMKMKKYVAEGKGTTYMWKIPEEYYHGTVHGTFMNLRVLKAPEEYLTYRYGEWRVPNSNWNTLRDDGGIIAVNYDEFDKLMCKG